ncbi:MAG: hypothetical protein GF349_03560 [Candidatus Magasanikbacteria bacterium]|nr:hypothetical protein [Candidatus Magasanikbacteria bacterium]
MNNSGVSIVELLVVVGITLILAATAVPIYGNLQVSAQINENSAQIVQAMRIAREKSVSGNNNSRYGVKFESDRYILYQGSSYPSRNSDYDREVVLNEALVISSTFTNDEINFSKGSGLPDQSGTTTLKHRLGDQAVIFVNQYGLVERKQ